MIKAPTNHFKNFASTRLDAADTVFFRRELEHLMTRSFDVKLAELRARELFPVNNEAGPGDLTIVYQEYDITGSAKVISDYAADLPAADAKGRELRQPIVPVGSSFRYSLQEVQASAKTNKRLTERKMLAAKRHVEQTMDSLAAFGDASVGMKGALRRDDTSTFTLLADGTGSSKTWVTKTPEQILRDMNCIVEKIISETNDVEHPDTLIVPPSQYALIASTPRSTNSDTSILKYFLDNSPYIKNVGKWARLNSAGGSMNTTRAMAYRRDADAIEFHIPEEFTMLPVQEENLAFKVPCYAHTGGVVVYYPKSICYADGL